MIFGVVAWSVMLGDVDGMFDFLGGVAWCVILKGAQAWGPHAKVVSHPRGFVSSIT